ncbi:uroporphyrinogen-III synthase [Nautilia sp. PV-1]|uniref:uroporphyrinogen-III synthase n=1 Tax=Nautilia sp. PV-1 TaxID=2579250 RepID=UPI000FD97228|nr:uroporphyrinogen-III synthase [Nautilia sp. PV-1]AZV46672.1 uroporphyrinogen-III synthase [Nautilia sp. PV-1]
MKSENLPVYLLTDQKIDGVLNYPVIKINFLSPSFSFENTDYLIFTSKNGVRAVDKLTDEWKKYPSLAIGKATAAEIEKLGGRVEYIAKNAYGDEFAKEINQRYQNKTFLFFRAKKLVSNIEKEFINNTLKEVIIYETLCNRPDTILIKPSVVIFTSPSTASCFAKIENFENIFAVAIGKKTQKELYKYINKVYVANKPSINECIKLAKSLKIR